MATTQAQRNAVRAWEKKHPEMKNYYNLKSRATGFIRPQKPNSFLMLFIHANPDNLKRHIDSLREIRAMVDSELEKLEREYQVKTTTSNRN